MIDVTPLVALLLGALSILAGAVGAISGVGGGAVLVPVMVLGFGVSFPIAVAVSLAAVVANSVTSASAYVRQGLAHKRLAMNLEVATVLGGITGALVIGLLSDRVLEALFAAAMFLSVELTRRRSKVGLGSGIAVGQEPGQGEPAERQAFATAGIRALEGRTALTGLITSDTDGRVHHYRGRNRVLGSAASLVAGVMSGLLGVGGGFIKVPAMTSGMRIPVRVASATSQYMIGVTAVSSLLVAYAQGRVYPLLAAPVVLGTALGSFAGARLASRLSIKGIDRAFMGIVLAAAVVFLLRSVGVLPSG